MPSFLESIFSFFRPAPYPKDNASEPAQITNSKVLVIVYDPVMDKTTGVKLSKRMGWQDTSNLLSGFTADILETSKGLVRYNIVERIEVDEFPAKTDGFRYTPQSFLDVMNRAAQPHMPQEADYNRILSQFNILQRVARNEIDEVWMVGFPHAGFYESSMGGPGAFWCNAPALPNTSASKRRFVVMGFSYERGIGEMHESYGHRAESIMEKTFSKTTGDANLWNRFIRYEKNSPGKAACGNVHYAPNSQSDYDWGNSTPVKSECYDWLLNFPNFKGDIRIVNSNEWGGGEIRAHHKWWFDHFPRTIGRKNGIHNNWWQYIAAPQNVIV